MVSTVLKTELFKQNSDDPFLFLLTLEDPKGSFPPVYLVNNLEDIISRGNTYLAFPMAIALPVNDGETVPALEITLTNVTLEFMEILRAITTPLKGTVEAVLASRPALVELSIKDLELREIKYDRQTITATFTLKDMLNLGLPKHNFTPTFYPGLFK